MLLADESAVFALRAAAAVAIAVEVAATDVAAPALASAAPSFLPAELADAPHPV